LPRPRIPRAQILCEIHLQEDPAPARFGARKQSAFRAAANLLRVHVQKGGGVFEIERPQARVLTIRRLTNPRFEEIRVRLERASNGHNARKRHCPRRAAATDKSALAAL
jgi:hypothetical protein